MTKLQLIFATNNQRKIKEASDIMQGHVQLISMHEIGCYDEIPETAHTFADNALIKARYLFGKYHINCMADDSGLEVFALNGEPGIHSARYASNHHNSVANIEKLLSKLRGVQNRQAQFRTVIALIFDQQEILFEGVIQGTILDEPRGVQGFGYDPIFVPNGYQKTFAELGMGIKNRISQRAIALAKVKDFLSSHCGS